MNSGSTESTSRQILWVQMETGMMHGGIVITSLTKVEKQMVNVTENGEEIGGKRLKDRNKWDSYLENSRMTMFTTRLAVVNYNVVL